MKLITLLLGVILPLAVYSQSEKLDWNADLDYLATELSDNHYNFFTVKSRDYFLSGINAIKQESGDLSDFQVAIKTQQLIARFGDSHTMLNFGQMLKADQTLPMHLLWASDGLYVLRTTPENEEILGSRLLAINNVPVATVIDSLSTLFAIDNQAMVKLLIPQTLPSLQILKYFGFADADQVELSLVTEANQNKTYILRASAIDNNNFASFKPDSVSFCTQNENQVFTDRYFPEDKIYYILYNRCLSKEVALEYGNKEMADDLPSFKEFEEKILNTLTTNPVKAIIFDVRHNGGGSSAQGTMLAEKIAEFLKTNPTIKTYVATGRGTFSSAILNAMDFKRLTGAVFVGEQTAGKPNHFGEVRSFRLPSSGLTVNYSTNYFKTTDEDVNTIKPDIEAEMSFSDFKKGIDPVYEWIRRQ